MVPLRKGKQVWEGGMPPPVALNGATTAQTCFALASLYNPVSLSLLNLFAFGPNRSSLEEAQEFINFWASDQDVGKSGCVGFLKPEPYPSRKADHMISHNTAASRRCNATALCGWLLLKQGNWSREKLQEREMYIYIYTHT